jgi:hypothetical protein
MRSRVSHGGYFSGRLAGNNTAIEEKQNCISA